MEDWTGGWAIYDNLIYSSVNSIIFFVKKYILWKAGNKSINETYTFFRLQIANVYIPSKKFHMFRADFKQSFIYLASIFY